MISTTFTAEYNVFSSSSSFHAEGIINPSNFSASSLVVSNRLIADYKERPEFERFPLEEQFPAAVRYKGTCLCDIAGT